MSRRLYGFLRTDFFTCNLSQIIPFANTKQAQAKIGKIVGHLKKVKKVRFTEAIFLMLRCDPLLKRTVILEGSWCNLDGGEVLQGVPCNLLMHNIPKWSDTL